jgi:hypothetical protein
LGLLSAVLPGCVSSSRVVAPEAPLWDDPDRQPFAGPPAKYRSGKYSDIIDQSALRLAADAFAFDVHGEALNLNTLDEVPDSSWFTNRLGLRPMTPEQVGIGPCETPPLDAGGPLTVLSSKSDGIQLGFAIRAPDGRRYLLKFDDSLQGPRSTAADAIVSRLYYAAGYNTPCNRVVFLERSQLEIAPDAQQTDWLARERPLSNTDLDTALTRVARTSTGQYRALASLWLDGKSLGPWRFEGTRGDDPNDIVPHENRRELRGMRLLAAWLGHGDQREQNTLASWMDAGNGLGWIRHNLLDFGDCLGHLSSPPPLARRLAGHSYGLDWGQITADLLSFGTVVRPFEAERFGPSGPVFGYFGVERFDPERWRPTNPNPAFQRMTERDGAWMARILARFEPAHIERSIRSGRLGVAALGEELLRVLLGRRERILRRYLPGHSSLSLPVIEQDAVCADDLSVLAGLTNASGSQHSAWLRLPGQAARPLAVRVAGHRACVTLPPAAEAGERFLLDWRVRRTPATTGEGSLRVSFARRGLGAARMVALQRLP